ncbi:hypothetical protein DJ568_09800 [Mucilaginibacter hurinus]|uniref:DUF4185 domain-containing protein n=1 Tax=Mucilaginibacter hurinus TaxID=2201324 RepID=A0A367GNY5_9SPHI|nr:DUF4185 domain-containing protein [Mucilaginibacter hurinus]RCH54768.1 hypothetical protein DJ568_09800 [Mucilaginibacter hurinus]
MKIFLAIAFIITANTCFSQNKMSSLPRKAVNDSIATAFFKRDTGWNAGDGAFSIPLANGKVLWTFGDSYVNMYNPATKSVPCLFNTHSAALLQPGINQWEWTQSATLNQDNKSVFENPAGHQYWFWPAGGIQLTDTVYIFCFNLTAGNGGEMNFKSNSVDYWAKIKYPEMKVISYSPLQNFNGISFGQGFVKDDKSGFVYAYGSKGHDPGKLYVARFPILKPTAKWDFWDGTTWQPDIKKISPSAQGKGFSNIVSKVKNKYVMTTAEFSMGCDLGKRIYTAVSETPTGPFVNSKLIYTIPDKLEGHSPFFYAAILHPEFINENNEVLLTYCINGYGNCVKTCVDNKYDPNLYRPKAVRVPLKLIDDSL